MLSSLPAFRIISLTNWICSFYHLPKK